MTRLGGKPTLDTHLLHPGTEFSQVCCGSGLVAIWECHRESSSLSLCPGVCLQQLGKDLISMLGLSILLVLLRCWLSLKLGMMNNSKCTRQPLSKAPPINALAL